MEQRIEVFCGCKVQDGQTQYPQVDASGNAFKKAKLKSEQLLEEGWFIHEMVSQDFSEWKGNIQSQLMVVYRRKA
jgi:hypothetical protein